MPELRPAAVTLALTNFEIGGAAQSFSQLAENLACLDDSLFRQHGIRILLCTHRSNCPIVRDVRGAKQNNRARRSGPQFRKLQQATTDPPFTLMTAPVMKLARSEARNRMGPAISSAVAARPSGMAAATIFWPGFELRTSLDMSVATHPGATELTRMLWRASSEASPLVRLIIPPLDAP